MSLNSFFIFHWSRKKPAYLSWIPLLHSRGGREKEFLWISTLTPFQESEIHEKTPNRTKAFRIFKQAAHLCLFLPPWFTQMSVWFLGLQKHLVSSAVPSQQGLRHNCTYSASSFPHCFVILELLHVLQIDFACGPPQEMRSSILYQTAAPPAGNLTHF